MDILSKLCDSDGPFTQLLISQLEVHQPDVRVAFLKGLRVKKEAPLAGSLAIVLLLLYGVQCFLKIV